MGYIDSFSNRFDFGSEPLIFSSIKQFNTYYEDKIKRCNAYNITKENHSSFGELNEMITYTTQDIHGKEFSMRLLVSRVNLNKGY